MDKSQYSEIREIYSYIGDDHLLLGYAAWKFLGDNLRMALFDKNGKQLTDFVFGDCGYEAEGYYLDVSDQLGIYSNPEGNCNIFDFRKKRVIFFNTYKSIEVVDAENNIFYVSDDVENGFNGQLINISEDKIGNKFLRIDPSTIGLHLPSESSGVEFLPAKMYSGELLNRKECCFIIEGTKILPWRIYSGIFIPRDQIDLNERHSYVGPEALFCLATDSSNDDFDDSYIHFERFQYKFIREADLQNLPTTAEKKKYGKKLHVMQGCVYDIIACYRSTKEDNLGIIGSCAIHGIQSLQDTPTKLEDGRPLIGWNIVFHNATIDTGAVYNRGCDGMHMTLISIDDCACDQSKISDLDYFLGDLTSIFNYMEHYLRPDTAGIEKKIAKRTESLYCQAFPFLTSIDYYGHTILPCYEVAQEFLKIAKDAKRTHNEDIEKSAHEAYKFLVSAREKFDYPHCLFVRFDGV